MHPAAELAGQLAQSHGPRIVALLAHKLGRAARPLAEEALQESLLAALRQWPVQGIPRNPAGWLYRAAWRRCLDAQRYDQRLQRMPDAAELHLRTAPAELAPDLSAPLRLLFRTCVPELAEAVQLSLSLKWVCGLRIPDIAALLLEAEATTAQRLTRARKLLQTNRALLDLPAPAELAIRRPQVLHVLYLLHTTGYSAGSNPAAEAVQLDLVLEALRLARELAAHPALEHPDTHALAALLCLQAARMPARAGLAGEAMLLLQQDRRLWDASLIRTGMQHLRQSQTATQLSRYHLEAGIAACHASAATAAATDWPAILRYYDLYRQLWPSALVQLNRLVALAHVVGPAAALAELPVLEADARLRGYHLLPATAAWLHQQAQHPDIAAVYYTKALHLAPHPHDRELLAARLQALQSAQ